MKNLFSYEGKRVLISGAGSGMGEATARIVQSLGAEVVTLDIKKPPIDDVTFLEVDLRDAGAIEAAVTEVVKGGPIDALFNSAGLP